MATGEEDGPRAPPESASLTDARLLSSAFTDYPLSTWLFGYGEHTDTPRMKLFDFLLSQAKARGALLDRSANGQALAIWMASNQLPLFPEQDCEEAVITLKGLVGPQVAGKLLKLHREADRYHPSKLHDYLFLAAVHPALQRSGVGRDLILKHLHAGRGDRGFFLETSNIANVRFYEALGFAVTAEYRLLPPAPPIWTMWHSPVS